MRIIDWSSDVCSSDLSDRAGRGREPFVAVPWDEALDMAAAELERIKAAHGNSAFYAGSYGWASAGRFHHANSHIHRFFNQYGGYVRHEGTYSYAAAQQILPHVVGKIKPLLDRHTTWPVLAEHCELLVRSEEHKSELQSLMRNSYDVFC